MEIAVPVVVKAGVCVEELGVEEEVPTGCAGGARGEGGVHEADRTEGVEAEALDNGGGGVDDRRRVEVVLEHVAGLVEGAGHRALAPDHRPAVQRAPDVLGGDAARRAFLDGAPLAVVIVVDGSRAVGLAGAAGERVVLEGDFQRRGRAA